MTHQTCDGENPPFLVEVYGGLAPRSCLGFPRFPLLSSKFQMLVLPDDFTSAMNLLGREVLFGVAVLDSYYIDGVWFLYRLEDTYTPAGWLHAF